MKILTPFYLSLATLISYCITAHADQEATGAEVNQALTVAKIEMDTQLTNSYAGVDTNYIAETERAITQYEQMIEELENSGGAYQDRLSETLLGLGTAYQRLEKHDDALTAFNRSLQITRVNTGLYDLSQLPILEEIMKSNFALQNWKGLDDNYHYLDWVNRRNYPGKNIRRLPVIARLGRWHLNAYELETGQPPFKHLLDAQASYTKAIDIIESQYGPSDPRLITPLYAVALSNFKMGVHATFSDDTEGMNLQTFFGNDGVMQLINEQKAKQNLIFNCYIKGKKAMIRVVDIFTENPQLPIDNHATAMIRLADWYLMHNKSYTAMGVYEEAFDLLSDSGVDKDGIDKLLGTPTSLPAYDISLEYANQSRQFGSGNSDRNNDQDNSQGNNKYSDNYVLASMDITKTGRTKNVKILEIVPSDSIGQRRRILNLLKSVSYRPRFENGQPVVTSDFQVHYTF